MIAHPELKSVFASAASDPQAIHARQYYQDQLLDSNSLAGGHASASSDGRAVAEQQLRYYARFILVCIMLAKKEVRQAHTRGALAC